jgi:hypothetical protein
MAISIQNCKDEAWAILQPKIDARLHQDVTAGDKNKIYAINREITDSIVEAVLQHVLDNAEVELRNWANAFWSAFTSAVPVAMDGGAAIKASITGSVASVQRSEKIK